MNLFQLLEKCGYRRVLAATLAYMIQQQGKDVSSREIEVGADLRQPETNVAVSQLLERGWISLVSQRTDPERKGRPVNVYRIVPNEKLYSDMEKEIDKTIKEKTELKTQLRVAMKLSGNAVATEIPHVSGKQLSILE
jgi:predicted transcriptional regulator